MADTIKYLDYTGLQEYDDLIKADIDSKLSGKSDSSHTHDGRYYTESEIDSKLSGKANSSHSHSAATTSAAGFMSTTDKTKLDGIATGAQVNQNAFSNVVVGSTTIAADTTTDSLTIAAGTGISVSGDATNDKVTITNSGVRSISTGSSNGTISVNTNGTSANVAVKGLGSAAYTASTAYDAAGTAQTKADAALASAKSYTDSEIADLINSAPTTLDTLGEIATAMETNADVVEALETAVGTKANASDLTSHTGNTTVHITATERTNWNAAKTHADAKGSAYASGLYKIATNDQGHVTAATAVAKADITALGIPSSNTDTKVTQAYSTTDGSYPILATATSGITSTSSRGATTAIVNNGIYMNPSTGSLTATKFIGALQGNADTATTCTGNAATATKLASAKTLQTNLGSTSAVGFDGSANKTIGVTGTLPITNGGTGATTAAAARTALGITPANIGAAASSHNQASSTINAMTGYSIASSYTAVATSDSLNTAIGKIERGLNGVATSVSTLLPEQRAITTISSSEISQLFEN